MTKAKAETYKIGETLEGVETVVRPGGSELTITGGLFVLDEVGTFVVNGNEVNVK